MVYPILSYIPVLFGVSLEVYVILLLLGVSIFFALRRILRTVIKDDKARKITTWLATIIATPLVYVGIIILWLFWMSYHPSYEFDRTKWLSDKEKRYELSDDIIESNMLIGKTKAEVRQILGDEGNPDESDSWDYYIGFKPDFISIDPSVLDIDFENGKVVKVGQHES